MAGRGRKVDANAIRRQGSIVPDIIDVEDPDETLPMPESIAADPVAVDCWGWIVSGGQKYRAEDIPLLMTLCEWWCIREQCRANIHNADGTITTTVDTPRGEQVNPDIKTMKTASDAIRYYCAELGIGPATRTRLGLMDAMKNSASTSNEIQKKVWEIVNGAHR